MRRVSLGSVKPIAPWYMRCPRNQSMAKYWWMVLTILSLNANGLYTETKWSTFWSELPKSDILCIQEMHLISQQEFAFTNYAQSYDFFFSHGTSNSAGVFVAVCRSSGIIMHKMGEIPGYLLVLDFAGIADCGFQ